MRRFQWNLGQDVYEKMEMMHTQLNMVLNFKRKTVNGGYMKKTVHD